jgi:hypothetical protein
MNVGKGNSLYIINRSLDVVKTWWGTTNKVVMPANLKLALVLAAGVSLRTSVIIPSLLLSEDSLYNFFSTFTSLQLNGIEKVGVIDCYKISCLEKERSNSLVVWIGKNDFLIRKLETESKISPKTVYARELKRDSINATTSKGHADAMKNDSQAKTAKARKNALMTSLSSMKDFHVKNTYLFSPYTLKKIDPELLKFRPNREVAL